MQLGLLAVALLSNALSALAGGGAGLVQLPALILMGLPFPVALATHKVASVSLGVGASLRHAQESSLNARLSALILLSGLPGVWLGARTVLALPPQLSTLLLGLLTIALGVYSACRPQLGASSGGQSWTTERLALGALVLFAIGFLNGSLTSGTGLFVTLWLVRWTERALQGRQIVVVPGRLNRLIAALAHYLPLPWANTLSAAFSRRFRSRP